MSTPDFASLGLSPEMLAALEEKGFTQPSPIQAKVIPVLLSADHDVIGQAHTGTGKTAAFAIPLIERLDPEIKETQALILAPTRELALQVCREFQSLQGAKRFNIVPIYGGSSYTEQFRALKQGAHIVVGTPGRVLDHMDKGTLKINNLSYLVLDEADEMLNMGFIEDVEAVLANSPDERTILMFSATMPKRLMDIATRYMRNHELISVKQEQLTTHLTEQLFYEVKESDKFEALCRIIAATQNFYGIVFCRTKADVDNVAAQLNQRGITAEGLHGDIQQNQREKVLRRFKANVIRVLVATDVAARGIDVQELSHVVNFSLPTDPETYVHRIGRTGRAGREGTAISIITPSEFRKLSFIQKITKGEIKRGKL
ncbi:MAG TPA: DEAD/DEAH box helicase, partial [Pseudomonadales bacterium]|nr:DEAD/DEAH box helicase [Pseudomonadales bacterium]